MPEKTNWFAAGTKRFDWTFCSAFLLACEMLKSCLVHENFEGLSWQPTVVIGLNVVQL
jgi:hypothetical protein